MDSAKDFASELWKQVNPVSAVKGLNQAVSHPIDTLKSDADVRQDVYDQAEAAFKKGNYTEGAAHLLYSFIPFAGPQLNAAADSFLKGDYAKGAGASTGMGLALAAPEVLKGAGDLLNPAIKDAAQAKAADMYQSALKPSTTLSPTKAESAISTGLAKGIPVSEDGVAKLSGLIDDLNSKIKATVAANPTVPINKFQVASRLSDTADRFSRQVNPEADLDAISDAGNEFLRNQPGEIPAADAQALKTGTYQQLKGKSFGELKTASIEAQKALARGLKEELNTAFPELSGLNAQESRLFDLQPLLEKAVARNSNHQLIGIGTPAAAAAGRMVTGSGAGAGVAAVLKAVVDDPMIKSRLAIALNRAGVPMASVNTRLAAYSAALGNATTAEAPNGASGQ